MNNATRYPLDFDALTKGSIVNVKTIESIVQAPRGCDKYNLGALKLAQRIEQELAARGLYVTVVSDHGAIRVLTDPEASEYNYKEAIRGFDAMKRRTIKLSTVTVSELNEDQTRQHDRSLVVLGAMIAGAKSARKQAMALPHVRNTPSLPDATTNE